MNLNNKWILFLLICILKAVMDTANFVIPYNTGFFSLTSGWFDMWHISWWIILFIIAYILNWTDNWKRSILQMGAMGVIAFVVQVVLYNFLAKL